MNTKPSLPVNFWPQLFARVKEKQPRFFALIQTYAFVPAVISGVIWYVTATVLPDLNVAVPAWLTLIQSQLSLVTSMLAGVGIGAYGVAQTTIQTPSTPALAVVNPKAEASLTAEEAADLRQRLQYLESRIGISDKPAES